jgi:ubiquinone biosynthesis protein COQ4
MNTATSAIDTRIHPLTALRALRALRADPEDTRQIFLIFRALRGRSGERMFSRFQASPEGQRILAERRSLLSALSDRGWLSTLPPDSVGRAYLAFMESENLTAEGLVMASETDEVAVSAEVQYFRERMRDAHDLTHILTGYGRDGLGELCLLAFMNRHSRNLGQLAIIVMSWRRLPSAARAAVWEAYRNGSKAQWFPYQDFEALLERPLETVRHRLGIVSPSRYQLGHATSQCKLPDDDAERRNVSY